MAYSRLLLTFVAVPVGIILVIPAIVIILPVWCIGIIIKIFHAGRPRVSSWEEIIQFDPTLGWRPKKNVKTTMETEGIYRVTTGPDGWRGNYVLDKSDTVVIGDSFVFGQGTDDRDYFASQTKNAKVKPLGAPGYGTAHYLLLLKQLSHELQGKLVIWFVFTGNDYREAIRPTSYGYHFPFAYYDNNTGNYKIRTDNVHPKKLPFNFEKGYKTSMPELADLYHKNYFSDYAFGAFEYLVSEAKNHCEKYRAKFAIATIPLWWIFDKNAAGKVKRYSSDAAKFSSRYPDERTAEICERLKVPFRAGTDYFVRKDYLSNDFHWSKAGNRKAARIIDKLHVSFLEKK